MLNNNITSDKLHDEKDHGRNENSCDDGDEYFDLMPNLSATLREIQVFVMNLRCCECLEKGGFALVVKVTFHYIHRLKRR